MSATLKKMLTVVGALSFLVVMLYVSLNEAPIYAADSSDAEVLNYSLVGQAGSINSVLGTIAVTVPNGTDVTALAATFTLSPGASAKVSTTSQVSGMTANDFTNPVKSGFDA